MSFSPFLIPAQIKGRDYHRDILGNAFRAYRGAGLHLYLLKDVLEVSESEPAASTKATHTDWRV